MNIGRNSGGWPLVNFSRAEDYWALNINEGGRGLILNLHHWKAGHTVHQGWFVYVAFWFSHRFSGRKSWFW